MLHGITESNCMDSTTDCIALPAHQGEWVLIAPSNYLLLVYYVYLIIDQVTSTVCMLIAQQKALAGTAQLFSICIDAP